MTAGIHNIAISRSAPFDLPLTLKDNDGAPIDLTLLAPFYAQCRDIPSGTLLIDFTVVETDLVNGEINVTATVGALTLQTAMWDVLDSVGNRWVEGTAEIVSESVTQLPP